MIMSAGCITVISFNKKNETRSVGINPPDVLSSLVRYSLESKAIFFPTSPSGPAALKESKKCFPEANKEALAAQTVEVAPQMCRHEALMQRFKSRALFSPMENPSLCTSHTFSV